MRLAQRVPAKGLPPHRKGLFLAGQCTAESNHKRANPSAMDQVHATQQHEAAGNDVSAWRMIAQELLDASDVLRHASPTPWKFGAVRLMLCGLSIENFMKALWLKQGNRLSKDSEYLKVQGAGDHDLVQLAHATCFTVNDAEVDVLRRLSHFIKCGGRYPIPKRSQDLMLTSARMGGKSAATHWSTPSDDELTDTLIVRLESALS